MTKATQNRNNLSLADRLDSSRSGSRRAAETKGDLSEQYNVKPKPMYRIDNNTNRTLTALTGAPAIPPPTVESSFGWNGLRFDDSKTHAEEY